jgi:hypothetical protein
MSKDERQAEIGRLLKEARELEYRFRIYDYCAEDIRSSWLDKANWLRQQAAKLRKEVARMTQETPEEIAERVAINVLGAPYAECERIIAAAIRAERETQAELVKALKRLCNYPNVRYDTVGGRDPFDEARAAMKKAGVE